MFCMFEYIEKKSIIMYQNGQIQQMTNWQFFFYFSKKKKCQSLLSGKNNKYFKLLSAEFFTQHATFLVLKNKQYTKELNSDNFPRQISFTS